MIDIQVRYLILCSAASDSAIKVLGLLNGEQAIRVIGLTPCFISPMLVRVVLYHRLLGGMFYLNGRQIQTPRLKLPRLELHPTLPLTGNGFPNTVLCMEISPTVDCTCGLMHWDRLMVARPRTSKCAGCPTGPKMQIHQIEGFTENA